MATVQIPLTHFVIPSAHYRRFSLVLIDRDKSCVIYTLFSLRTTWQSYNISHAWRYRARTANQDKYLQLATTQGEREVHNAICDRDQSKCAARALSGGLAKLCGLDNLKSVTSQSLSEKPPRVRDFRSSLFGVRGTIHTTIIFFLHLHYAEAKYKWFLLRWHLFGAPPDYICEAWNGLESSWRQRRAVQYLFLHITYICVPETWRHPLVV